MPSPKQGEEKQHEQAPEQYTEEHLVDLIEQPTWKVILIDLIKTERMDPWNIDICLLADKYLKKIETLSSSSLRIPANAMLASAILLKTKAKYLRLSSLEPEEEEERFLEEFTEQGPDGTRIEVVPSLLSPKRLTPGRVSMEELIEAIESVMTVARVKRLKALEKPSEEEIKFAIKYDPSKDDIDARIKKVYEKIQNMKDSQGMVMFSELCNKTGYNTVSSFLVVLHLASQQKINLWQEEFFGEVFISVLNSSSIKKDG